jgi:hypothetical protein
VKKVGILYICTGKYWRFWEGFYQSSEQLFLNDCDVEYFRFTDYEPFLIGSTSNITSIYQESLEWPLPTLLRYKTFYENRELFNNVDYLIFCNANLKFVDLITIDNLLDSKSMFATLHPGWYGKDYKKLPFETNENSLALVERGESSKYVCGGFNGGKRSSFLKMSKDLADAVESDLERDIIACWHDESHFNKFFNDQQEVFNLLSPSFCSPEIESLNLEKKVIVLDKPKVIGVRNKGLPYLLGYYLAKYLKKLLRILGLR